MRAAVAIAALEFVCRTRVMQRMEMDEDVTVLVGGRGGWYLVQEGG